MRLFIFLGTLASIVCGSAAAQTCETMVIRDAAGQVVSNTLMCVDETGAWADPATRSFTDRTLPQNAGSTLRSDPPLTIPAPAVQPLPVAPLIVSEPIQTPVNTPTVGSAAAVALEQTPPADNAARVDEARAWQPTSGVERRSALYAKLGLVCRARQAMFCGAENACAGLCEGKQGWCDGKTGEIHASLESIERANCRKKKRR